MRLTGILAMLAVVVCPAFGVTVTSTSGCTSGVSGLTGTIDFNGQTATDAAGHATYTTPFFNQGTGPGCGGDWLSENSQTTTISFDAGADYFGLYWSSNDGYNSVQLFNGATLIGTYNGGSANITRDSYINFFADSGEVITNVVLSSSSCCFETDNHSYRLAETASTPEPATFIMPAIAGLWFGWKRVRFAHR